MYKKEKILLKILLMVSAILLLYVASISWWISLLFIPALFGSIIGLGYIQYDERRRRGTKSE